MVLSEQFSKYMLVTIVLEGMLCGPPDIVGNHPTVGIASGRGSVSGCCIGLRWSKREVASQCHEGHVVTGSKRCSRSVQGREAGIEIGPGLSTKLSGESAMAQTTMRAAR